MNLKLSKVSYAERLTFHISSADTLKSVYFVYFHTVKKYEKIWNNLQKKIVRIMPITKPINSRRSVFTGLEIRNFTSSM
jgi:hypothetical protein